MRPDSNTRPGMGTLLARSWWAVALRGALAILFGLGVLFWPQIGLAVLVAFFGAFAFVGGLFAVIAALRGGSAYRNVLLLIEGLIGMVIGLLAFFWPAAAGLSLIYLIAAWAVLSGILEIIIAIQLRKQMTNEWLLVAAGIASVIFGLLVAISPVAGAVAIVWVVGIYAIIFGVMLLIFAFRLRSWQKSQSSTPLSG